MSILNLDSCIQGEGESTTNWVRWISAFIHSSDIINAGSTVLMLEKNCRFLPLKQKLGWLKRNCNDMGELMAALVKYADSDSTKDPESDEEKAGKGKKSGNTTGQHNTASQGGNGKRKADGGLDFMANTNTQSNNQRRKRKTPAPWFGGPKFNLEAMMNQPCPKHGTQEKPASHLWKDCFIMREYRNSNFFPE